MTLVRNFAVNPIRYRESRRDQRLLLPRFRVIVDGCVLSAINWSLSGLLLQGTAPQALILNMPVAGLIAGENRHGPASQQFAARVARLTKSPDGLAITFDAADSDAGARVVDFLEDCLLSHLSRRGARQ